MPTEPRVMPYGWYALAHGSVYIVMIATELEVGPGSDQFNWLNITLGQVDRAATPWVIVLGHR